MTVTVSCLSSTELFLANLSHFSSSNSFCRYKLLRYSRERQYIDGLNNLVYTPKILVSKLYKNITVNLIPELAPVRDY